MSIPTYFLAAVLHALVSVFGIGLALTAWLDRGRRAEGARPDLLFCAAVGLYWNTLVFIGLYLTGTALARSVLEIKGGVELALVAVGLLSNRRFRDLRDAILGDGLTLAFLLGGALLGVWAMLEFPHVLDSGQILWTQNVLDGGMRQPVSAMMGYSALVGVFGALFPASPVVTTAAAFKPLLLGLYACLAVAVADVLAPRHRWLTALSFFSVSILSTFGTYGLLELGKDSMWGILFAMAFFATLCREDAGRRGIELALYFATAATLGVIALPYMAVAYGLWLLLSRDDEGAADTVPPLVLVNLPVLPTVLAGFLNAGLGRMYVAYGVLTLVLLACHRAGLVRCLLRALSRPLRPVRALIPIAFAVPAVLLFPVALAFPVWINGDGSVVTETRAPLDGATSFLGYIFATPVQDATVVLGIAASLVVAFTPIGRRRPGLVAVASMPALVLVLALTRAHLHVPIISDFNVWDMVKDIPQWFGGTLLVLVLIGAVVGISQFMAWAWLYPASLTVVTVFCVVAAARTVSIRYFTKPVSSQMYAAFTDADVAKVSDLAWSRLKGHVLLMDRDLELTRQSFYWLQMYGVRPSVYDRSKIDDALQMDPIATGLVVSDTQLPKIRQAVESVRGTIEPLASLSGGEASMLLVRLDGKNEIRLPETADAATVSTGHYDLEKMGAQPFYWMQAHARIDVLARDADKACLSLSMFDPGLVQGPATVTLKDGLDRRASVDVAGHSSRAPAVLTQTVILDHGVAELTLDGSGGEGHFPNDARKVAFGLLMPIRLSAGACEDAPTESHAP